MADEKQAEQSQFDGEEAVVGASQHGCHSLIERTRLCQARQRGEQEVGKGRDDPRRGVVSNENAVQKAAAVERPEKRKSGPSSALFQSGRAPSVPSRMPV